MQEKGKVRDPATSELEEHSLDLIFFLIICSLFGIAGGGEETFI